MIAICQCGQRFTIPDGDDPAKYICECGNHLPGQSTPQSNGIIHAEITGIKIPFMRLLDLVIKIDICIIISTILIALVLAGLYYAALFFKYALILNR